MSVKQNLQSTIGNQKSRIFLFLMLSIIAVVSLVAYTSRGRTVEQQKANAGVAASSNVVNPGAALESIPGLVETSPEYQRLQQVKYQETTTKALNEKGQPTSALPSLASGSENLSAIPGLNNKPETSYSDRLKVQALDQQKIQNEQLQRQQEEAARKQLDLANQKAQELMARQIALLASTWQVVPQQLVNGKAMVYPAQVRPGDQISSASGSDRNNPENKPKIYYKAGDILFGVMITSVNSDQPGPILARIVSGPLSGAKLIGTINPATIPQSATSAQVSRSLILQFNLLNIPGKKISVPVTAVAIDPDTANTGLATSVNNHYILRYGTFFAANFLSGIGTAISASGQTKIVTGNGSVDVGSTNKFSSADQSKIALGKTADAFAKTLNFLDTPPTIKISSGTAIGILLQNDMVIQDDNTQQLINQAAANSNINNNLYNSGYTQGRPNTPAIPSGGPVIQQPSLSGASNNNIAYGVAGNGGTIVTQ